VINCPKITLSGWPLLASIGVYGVVSYSVSRRVHETGIRMTMGAEERNVVSLLLRQALRAVVIGALVGIAGCTAVSQVLADALYGARAHDPVVFMETSPYCVCPAL